MVSYMVPSRVIFFGARQENDAERGRTASRKERSVQRWRRQGLFVAFLGAIENVAVQFRVAGGEDEFAAAKHPGEREGEGGGDEQEDDRMLFHGCLPGQRTVPLPG